MRRDSIHTFAAPMDEPSGEAGPGSAGEKPKQSVKPSGEAGPGSAGEKKDLTHLLDLLSSIIKTTSGKRGLHVTTQMDLQIALSLMKKGQNPDEAWYAYQSRDKTTGKKVEYVHVPPKILEGHEDIAKGKAAHEGGHIAVTRGGEIIPDHVVKELGLPILISAAEECPPDQVVRERYPGAGEWVDFARRAETVKGAAAEAAGKQLGYMPKLFQLADLIVYGPHYTQMPAWYAPDVIAAYERMKPDIERMERTLPKDGAEEPEILAAAKNRWRMVYKKMWPTMKQFVTEDLKDEALRQMAGGVSKDDILDQLPEELKKELEKALEKGKETEGEKNGGTEEQKESEGGEQEGEEGEGGEGGTKEQKNGETKEQKGGSAGGQAETEGAGSSSAKASADANALADKTEGAAGKMDMQQLSEALKDALQKMFDALPKTVQEALKKEARKALERLEDTVVDQMQSKLVEPEQRIETHAELRKREAREVQEARRQEEEEKIAEDRKKIEEREEKIQKDKSAYDRAYEEVRALDEILYRRLEEIFTPNIKRTTKLSASGSRINLPAVFRWKAGKAGGATAPDYKIFERMHIPEKRDYAFILVVDLSTSMAMGGKIEETFKAVVLLSEVLNRLGIPFEVIGFSNGVDRCKEMEKPLDDRIRVRMNMLSQVIGGTETHLALSVASRDMQAVHAKEKFILCMTDGQPNSQAATESVIMQILTETDQKLVGIGLGPGTDLVEHYFPAAIPNITVQQLPEVLGALLEDVILHPEKYTYR